MKIPSVLLSILLMCSLMMKMLFVIFCLIEVKMSKRILKAKTKYNKLLPQQYSHKLRDFLMMGLYKNSSLNGKISQMLFKRMKLLP